MLGGEITPDEHNKKIYDIFVSKLKRVPDPSEEFPDAQRYEISLPWNSQENELSSNRYLAFKRMDMLTKKFDVNEELERVYTKQFNDWYSRGFIEEVPNYEAYLDDLEARGEHYCILPHHVVIKLDSKTTPYRIVLDGSAHEKGKPSLNDCLETGPNLLPSLKRISMRFRFGKVYYMSDISKAFFMLKLNKADSNRLYIYWVKIDGFGKRTIALYKFLRMPWGLNTSPFCLNATLQHHLQTFESEICSEFPDAEKVLEDQKYAGYLRGEIYMDDIIQADDHRDTIIKLAEFAKRALALGCFVLVKIESNDPDVHNMYNPDSDP
jgi:hypothetical protein